MTMKTIKNVKVFPSEVKGYGPGFAVVIDQPTTQLQKERVADAIRYALEDLRLRSD